MENNENVEQIQTPEMNYAEVIKNLKATTVSREEYERVMNENKTLANALATSPAKSTDDAEVELPTDEYIDGLRDKLFKINGSLSNREFIKTSLDLRDALMARGERDPCLPVNKEYIDNPSDMAAVNNLANGLRQIVDYCGNDDSLFNSELKRVCR